MTAFDQPPWLLTAWRDIGVAETPGSGSNPSVLAYYRDSGQPSVRSDDVPWCAAFVGAMLQRAGETPTGSLLARSYLSWGRDLEAPKLGAIAVLSRGAEPWQGHVGFLVGLTDDRVFLLSGNQDDRVSVEAFDRARLLGLRWPSNVSRAPVANDPSEDTVGDPFNQALAHVLDMEGGYTDDPHDPGGPTNLGITLATLASWRGLTVDTSNYLDLREAVRNLDRKAAAEIYRARYWRPSRSAELPPGLDLMHFDACVNHGVNGAAHILQQVLDVTTDGEIGPETLGAAARRPASETIDRYARLREARYRALPHFWRFGRGWLARVGKTRAAARARIGIQSSSADHTGDTNPMPEQTSTTTPKWWGNSLTIWGVLITALTNVLPVLGPLIGITLTPDIIREVSDGVVALIQAAGGLIGSILAIYGRVRATQPLVRRPLSIKL